MITFDFKKKLLLMHKYKMEGSNFLKYVEQHRVHLTGKENRTTIQKI